MYNNAILY